MKQRHERRKKRVFVIFLLLLFIYLFYRFKCIEIEEEKETDNGFIPEIKKEIFFSNVIETETVPEILLQGEDEIVIKNQDVFPLGTKFTLYKDGVYIDNYTLT